MSYAVNHRLLLRIHAGRAQEDITGWLEGGSDPESDDGAVDQELDGEGDRDDVAEPESSTAEPPRPERPYSCDCSGR